MKIKIPLNWNRMWHILFMLLLCHGLFSQITVDIKNKPLKDALKEIESKSSLRFFYNNDLKGLDKVVSLKVSDARIDTALDQLLSGSEIGYQKQDENVILLIPKKAGSQENLKKINGVVKDENGEAVIGASVKVKGALVGTVTNLDGSFSLDVPQDATLIISYIGLSPQEIKVDNQTTLNIILAENSELLDEVVVVGYGVQKKRDLTGAISQVKMADMPVNTISTVSHALAGKAAGLRVTQNSGQPGAGTKFRIRGETSIKAGNDPLIIIDGFPVSSSSNPSASNDTRFSAGEIDNVLESLNPNDIESIEVLKDASATAIYGSRAGHGVIIITTKRGSQSDRVKVSYSGGMSVQHMSGEYKVLNARQFRELRNMKEYENWLKTNGQGIYAGYITPNSNPAPFVPRYTDSEIASVQTTDWFNEVARTGFSQSHNLSVSGGSEKAQYLVSVNYFDQKGIVKNNNMDRLTANVNNDYTFSKYVKAGFSLNVSRNQYDNVPLGQYQYENAGIITSAVRFDPAQPVRDEQGNYSLFPDMTQYPNPVSLLEVTDVTTKDRIRASSYLQAEPVKGLLVKSTIGFDRRSAKRKQYVPNTTMYGAASGGIAYQRQDDGTDYLFNITASYNKSIGKHSFSAMAGYEYQLFNSENFWASNYNFSTDGFLYNNLGAGSGVKGAGSGAGKNALGSYFSRVTYNFADKYLLTASFRADGEARFNPDYRWGYFPSVSLAWRFNEESFMQNMEILSNGKLRAGYGETGNSNVGNRTLDYYGIGERWVFGETGNIGVKATQLGNYKLTWETTSEYNIGLDLGFIDNRFNVTLEYYNRIISDLLVTDKKLPSYNELTEIAANIGKTQGQGFEVTLNTTNIKTNNLTWSTDVTFSTYKDRWKERDPSWKPAHYQSVNDPIRSIYVYRNDGLLQVGEQAPKWQSALLPGQIKIKNLSDEGGSPNVYDQYDQVLLGSEDPAFTFGFNNSLKYKQFDFNAYFYGEVGRWRNGSYYESWIPGQEANNINMSTGALDSWRHDNQSTTIPSTILSAYPSGDYFYKKISFVRCRNLTLGYTVPGLKNKISSVRVYADVNNPFVITNWTGLDPETDQSFSYPNVRSFSIGLDIHF